MYHLYCNKIGVKKYLKSFFFLTLKIKKNCCQLSLFQNNQPNNLSSNFSLAKIVALITNTNSNGSSGNRSWGRKKSIFCLSRKLQRYNFHNLTVSLVLNLICLRSGVPNFYLISYNYKLCLWKLGYHIHKYIWIYFS